MLGPIGLTCQFTLHGDCRKGRRPSFIDAAAPEVALPLYEEQIDAVKTYGIPRPPVASAP